jgi:thiol-disulfide isomerase/thioredoxin
MLQLRVNFRLPQILIVARIQKEYIAFSMKVYFILILLFIIRLAASAQTSIKIILKSNLKVDSVSITDISFQEFYESAYKDTLIFSFKKNNIDCYNIRYSIKQKLYHKQIWLNAGNVIVDTHLTDTAHMIIDTVINSPVYYSVADYFKQTSKIAKDTIARNAFMLYEIEKNLENTRSIAIATDYINFNENSKVNLLKLKFLLSHQKTDFSWFRFYSVGIERMNKILEIKNIDFSQFNFINRKNEIVSIKSKSDQFTLLDFWFVGCVPCMLQHKELKLNMQKLIRNHIHVIGISTDKEKEMDSWNNYLSKHGYNWDNYLQSGAKTLSDYLSINAFPEYILLNQKGEIVKTYGSVDEVLNSLQIN